MISVIMKIGGQIKVFHISVDSAEFLVQILRAIEYSHANPQMVYPLLQVNLDKLSLHFAKTLKDLVTFVLAKEETTAKRHIADRIVEFGNLILDFPGGDKATNIEISIAAYQATLSTVFTPRHAFPKEWAIVQLNLGSAYRQSGLLKRTTPEGRKDIEDSIQYLKKALEFFDGKQKEYLGLWAFTQGNLGLSYSDRIEGNKAENLELAIKYLKNVIDLPGYRENFPYRWAGKLRDLAAVYGERILGDIPGQSLDDTKRENLNLSIGCCEKALKVFEEGDVEWALTQWSLGSSYKLRSQVPSYEPEGSTSYDQLRSAALRQSIADLKTAISCLNKAQQILISDPRWGSVQFELGTCYKNLGGYENPARNFKEAVVHYEQSLKVCDKNQSPFSWADRQNSLGNAYKHLGNFKQATTCFNKALEVFTRDGNHPEKYAQVKANIGHCYRENKQYVEAYNPFKEAIDIVESLRDRQDIPNSHSLSWEANRKLAEEWNMLYQAMIDTCLTLRKPKEAVEYLERSKARNLSDLLANGTQHTSLSRISFEQIQGLIDKNTVIVEWHIADISCNRIQVFIISSSAEPQVWQSPLPDDLQHLNQWFSGYFLVYHTDRANWKSTLERQFETFAKILHLDQIIANIQRVCPQCNQVVLVPHRFLHLLPLHALPLADGKCLLDKFESVRYAPSCQILQQVQQRKRPDFKTFFAVQNPTSDLDFADIEVGAIRQKFKPNDTVLVEENATKMAVIQAPLSQVHCLHFSCHGIFNFVQPLTSALRLADSSVPSSTPEHLRIHLNLGDIFQLSLNRCRLVTLSACETGQVDPFSTSDEYIGIPAGFLYAGARTVVSSLWAVSDVSTTLLLIKFYQNLMNNTDNNANALNDAQRWLRQLTCAEANTFFEKNLLPHVLKGLEKSTVARWQKFLNEQDNKQPFKNPNYWAAFVVTGV